MLLLSELSFFLKTYFFCIHIVKYALVGAGRVSNIHVYTG